MLLKGKKAVITGGTRGIGFAIAEAFVKNGAHVIIVGAHEPRAVESAQRLKQSVTAADQEISYLVMDVSDYQAVHSIFDACHDKLGAFDIVVNCAGITRDQLLLKMSEKEWDEVLDVNLKSVFNICKAAIKPMLKARRGKIINITSVIGLIGNPGQVNYSASKFGMIGFTKSLAKEVAKRGICVNCIAPGFIETDMTAGLNDSQKQELIQQIPMQKFGKGEDIGQAALFLASSMSDYMTGQVLTIDGGMLA